MDRAFTSAGIRIPVVKEPTGLVHGTDLRPDGLTLIPWAQGIVWVDVCLGTSITVVDSLAQTNLNHSVHQPGSAAETDAEFKERKYSSLTWSHYSQYSCLWLLKRLALFVKRAQELINKPRRPPDGEVRRSTRARVFVSATWHCCSAWQFCGTPRHF